MQRLALVMVAAPAAAWVLEQAARRAEARDNTFPASRRPQRRVRVFGCCLPIPLGVGLLSAAGLRLLHRRVRRSHRS